MSDLIGRTLGAYRILSQIGRGGMATVYKAYQPSLDRYVAIKVLPAYFAEQDETFLRRFKQEARAIAKLRHPNILVVHEYGEEQGATYIVMEYVEAGTLTERLRQPMALAEVEPLLRQVAAALDYAHEQKVIHRDIKPSNILLKSPDWPLLTDFGLAKIVGGTHLTQTGAIFGTPAYMSPEQGRGEALDARSDIYSLGIVLYEMATGAVPYTAETPMAVVVKHIIEPLPFPRTKNPALPEAVELVILKALAKDPADRFARAGDMAQELTEALARAPTISPSAAAAATVPPSGEPTKGAALEPPRARRLVGWVLGGIGCLAVAAVAALALAFGALSGGSTDASLPGPTSRATRTVDQLMADGSARLDQGEPAAAVEDYQDAVSLDPTNLDLFWEIASTLEGYGYPEEAAGFLGLAVASAPDDPSVHDTAAWHYIALGYYPEAISEFQRILDLDPEAVWPLVGQAQAYQAMGDWDSSRMALDNAMSRPPSDDPDFYENIGWAYSAIEAWAPAQDAFRSALEMDPGNTDAWYGLADASYYAGGPGAAIAVVQEALAQNPSDPSLHEKAGWYAWEQGDAGAAEAAFLQAIELDPAHASSYASLADVYGELGRSDEAIAILLRGIDVNPSEAWLRERLGNIYLERGEAQLAFEQFASALEVEPDAAWLGLETATANFRSSGDAQGSAVYLEHAAETGSDDPYLLEGIGLLYEEMGVCDRAVEYFRLALEIDSSLEGSQAGLGRCLG